jgi:hypothetical protein
MIKLKYENKIKMRCGTCLTSKLYDKILKMPSKSPVKSIEECLRIIHIRNRKMEEIKLREQ